MSKTEKAKIILESENRASKNFKDVKKDFGSLVAAITAGNIAANLASRGLRLLKDGVNELKDATKVAARIQVLNRVMLMTGQNAGYTSNQLKQNKQAIQSLGIAEQEALQIQQRFIQTQLDIADATKIARVAQDLAVIAGTNSSETALALTDALVKQRPILLKQFGIIANLDTIYGKQAKTLKKNVDQLTETERRQAFLNEILEQAKTVAGSYESAMEDVGKRFTSLPRHVQTFQNALGQHLLPVMGLAVDGTTDLLKALTRLFSTDAQNMVRDLNKLARASERFDKVSEKARALRDEYAKLIDISKPSVEQQDRMQQILKQLEGTYPGLILQVEGHTAALRTNMETLDDLLDAEQRQASSRQRDKLIEVKGLYADLSEELDRVSAAQEFARLVIFAATTATDEQRQALIEQKQAQLDSAAVAGASVTEYSLLSNQLLALSGNFADIRVGPLASYETGLVSTTAKTKALKDEVQAIIGSLAAMFPELSSNTEVQAQLGVVLSENVIAFQHKEAAEQAANAASKTYFETQLANIRAITGARRVQFEEEKVRFAYLREQHQRVLTKQDLEKAGVEEDALFEENAMRKSQKRARRHEQDTMDGITRVLDANGAAAAESRQKWTAFASAAGNIMMGASSRMVGALMDGKTKFADIFKDMAADFIQFFVQQAMAAILNTFVPGLGAILGGIFDTPANDRMAMTQGLHFAQWFSKGALDHIDSSFSNSFAQAASGITGGLAPNFASAGLQLGAGGSGASITFNNPVMTDDFVSESVLPIIESVTSGGKGALVIDTDNLTGKDDGFFI